ncbi:MAG: 50S ribosomal protein L25 [Acidimicrobiales bacterium]
MAEIVLTADTGRPTGSAASRRLRAEGKIPAVVYGSGTEAQAVTVDWRELRQALTTDKGLNAVITLSVNGDEHLTIVKDLQRHPVRRDVLHLDFLVVERDKPVAADVPIVLDGEPIRVIQERGVVDQSLHALTIMAKPAAIPGHLTIDISDMEIGDTLTVGDLSLPPGVTTEVDSEHPIASAQVTRAVEAEVAEGEEEAAEGEEIEGEAGEAGAPEGGESGGGDSGE